MLDNSTNMHPVRWWQNTVFYEIYIASFQDSNDDGIGDFKGLASRLDYLAELGIGGLWITPFYPSPKVDNGYDVADYYDVDRDFGTLADFDHFVAEAHKRNIKVIIDVVLNHVSTDHCWFKQAISSADNPYREFFFFQDNPNNWESFFGGSAWQKEPHGEQFYYHKFAVEQADLNWQTPQVQTAMSDMLRFWLARGVDGFRFDVINFLSCNGISENNPKDKKGQQIHQFDIDQPGVLDCIKALCRDVREYSLLHGKECFLVGEVGHDELHKLLPYQRPDLLDVVFNFNLGSITHFDIQIIYQQLTAMEKQHHGLATVFFNSHDMPRSMSRLCQGNSEHAAALATMTLMLNAVCFLYFGEEIGMPNYEPDCFDDIRDINAITHFKLALAQHGDEQKAWRKAVQESRDKSRLFMQWNTRRYAGFSQVAPWIGHHNIKGLPNVDQQVNQEQSLWSWYQRLIALRNHSNALTAGSKQTLTLIENVLMIMRQCEQETIQVVINFNEFEKTIPFIPFQDVLLSRGFKVNEPDRLCPFGVLITREKSYVC